tara:strand:- start:946 stop:2481 length:1536 start_codon:yes stop_codon:yes gene_type:complete
MVEQTVQTGEDGALDHHGETLPPLSKSASRINVEKIESKRRIASKAGDHPGVGWFYRMIRGLSRLAMNQQFRTIEVTGQEHIAEDAGILTVGWHTNGLIDPSTIFVTQPKMLVFGGRHDLITRPIIGPIASLSGAQPVLRQAELARGGASSEAGLRINGKTMLTLAECIAHGHGTALFPEGTSHEDSKMRRLRTGPVRSVIAANSIAHEKGLPEPHLLPVGLHYRTSWHFRTDAWFEYGSPISLDGAIHPPEDRVRLMAGEWVEAPAERVNQLRDEVRARLAPMTPDSSTWDEHRCWHVLGHLRTLAKGNHLGSWREEVLAAREIRDEIRGGNQALLNIQQDASQLAKKLHAAKLDGRSLDAKGLRKPRLSETLAIFPALLLAIFSAPLTLIGSGLMIFLGKVLGDRTDEGLDARTTYHLLASMLGPLLIWPLPILILSGTFWIYLPEFREWTPLFAVLLPILFHLSNKVAIRAWDFYVIARDARRINQLRRHSDGSVIEAEVTSLLAALK